MNERNVNVLLVEDNPSDALFLQAILSKPSVANFSVDRVETLAACLGKLQDNGADIVLIDLGLPDSSGLATLLKILTKVGRLPVVVLTGTDDQSLALQSLNSGAEDYIVKGDFSADSLSRALLHAIERKRMQARVEIQLEVAKAISESETFEDCISKTLGTICAWLNWPFGAFWSVDAEKETISCKSVWTRPEASLEEFRKASLESVLPTGASLPGQAWKNGQAIFVLDVAAANFDRSASAAKSGLGSAFAFPAKSGGRTLGVLEFLSRHSYTSDNDDLLQLFDGLGLQIGLFLSRKELELSHAHLASIVSSCEYAVIGENLDGIITSWNPAAERLFGYLASEAVGKPISIIVLPEASGELTNTMKMVSQGKTVEQLETLRLHKNGDQLDVLVSISPVMDATGQIIGASSVAHDITERKRVQYIEELITKEIVQHAPIGIARLNENLEIIFANPKLKELCRHHCLTAAAYSLFDLFPSLPREEIIAALQNDEPFLLPHFRYECEEESIKFSDITIWPAWDAADLVGGVLHVVDTTEQVLLEKQREDFTASIAHDIKNPLIGAQRLLRALANQDRPLPDDERQTLINVIRESNENLLLLVQNLIDLYRYGSVQLAVHSESVRIPGLINSCAEQLAELASSKPVKLLLDAPSRLRDIETDGIALRRVLANLIHNAIKFTPADGIVTIGAKQDESHTTITVSDTGCGIEPEEAEKLFVRFSQTRAGRTSGSGTGLGLHLCQTIMKALNGSIYYQPNRDAGSTFILKIPNGECQNDD